MEKSTKLSLIQYAFLALPLGFSGFPLYILAPDFYALHHGLSLSTLGFGLLCIRMLDALQDPAIGLFSDRYRAQITLFMGVSACVLVSSVYILFNASLFSPFMRFMLCMTFSITAYSVLRINLNAMGGLWHKDEKSQVRIASIREVFALFGLLMAVSTPHFLEKILPKDQVYLFFVMILFVLLLLGFWQFSMWYGNYAKRLHGPTSRVSLRHIVLSPVLKKFFCIYFLSMFASSIPAVLVIFFVRDFLGLGHYIGFFLLIYFLSAALFMPFWMYVSEHQGKYTAWFFSMMLATVSFIGAFFLKKYAIWQYGTICFFSGIALGGDLVFPTAIVSDHIHQLHGQKNASSYYALLNLLSKSSLAFASALSFFILDQVEFKAGGENFTTSLAGLSIAYALIPCIIKIVAAFSLWKIFIQPNEENYNENL